MSRESAASGQEKPGTTSSPSRTPSSATSASLVRSGQRVELISHADVGVPARARVASVAELSGGASEQNRLEARVRLGPTAGFRPGVTGEAHITVRRTNLFGGLWWAVRTRVRSDLLL